MTRDPLYDAANTGDQETLKKLIESGSDINLTSESGRTPLMFAALRGHLEIVRELLDSGADVKIKDPSGLTALRIAESAHIFDKDSIQDVAVTTRKAVIDLLRRAGG